MGETMKQTVQTAAEAMERSRVYDEIVYCEDTEENMEDLAMEADDSAENGSVAEYWGSDWRVHIIRRDYAE